MAVTIKQRLVAQGQEPTGMLGWLMAWLMAATFGSLYVNVARLLELQPDDDVLDVACGSGLFLKRHAAHVRFVAGLDHSEIQIRLARRWNRDRVAAGTAEFVQGDAGALPWPDNRFSAVTCNCLNCFKAPEQAVKEMCRVLRPGGRAVLVIEVVDADRSGRSTDADGWGLPVWTEDEARQMIADAGLSLVHLSYDKKMRFAQTLKS